MAASPNASDSFGVWHNLQPLADTGRGSRYSHLHWIGVRLEYL